MNNRIIKFRAWDGEQMTHLAPLEVENENRGLICVGEVSQTPKAIMQFTGLLDCNGKEIYEGDVVKSDWNRDKQRIAHAPVIFNGGKYTCRGLQYPLSEMPELEILGNIYENPDLTQTP